MPPRSATNYEQCARSSRGPVERVGGDYPVVWELTRRECLAEQSQEDLGGDVGWRTGCAADCMRGGRCQLTQNPGNKNGERNTRLAEHRHWTSRFTLCFPRVVRWHSPCCCQRWVLWFRPRWTVTTSCTAIPTEEE